MIMAAGKTIGESNAYDILDINVFQTLWQQSVEDSSLFQHDNVPVLNASSINKWFSPFGVEEFKWMNWNTDCEPDLITQHQCWMLLWLNGSKSLQRVRHLVESCYSIAAD